MHHIDRIPVNIHTKHLLFVLCFGFYCIFMLSLCASLFWKSMLAQWQPITKSNAKYFVYQIGLSAIVEILTFHPLGGLDTFFIRFVSLHASIVFQQPLSMMHCTACTQLGIFIRSLNHCLHKLLLPCDVQLK